MFQPTSRYYLIETLFWDSPDGTRIAYKRRRLLPQPKDINLLAEWPVQDDDRFDLIAARTLGDSQSFWRIADSNQVMDPNELTTEPGRRLVIALPEAEDLQR